MAFTRIHETRMICKAIQQGWPIDVDKREGIIEHLQNVLIDPAVRPREFLAACRAIIAAEAQNQAAEV